MTRIISFAVMFVAAVAFSVTNANAQCASCSQGSAPSFTQSYAAPSYAAQSYAAPSYAAPTYAQPQVSYAAPISTGCGCAAPAPISPCCCAAPAPISPCCYAAPAPISPCCYAAPQRVRRVVVVRRSRGNTCSTCNSCY